VHPRVLVVDDDAFTRRLMCSVLSARGQQVRACASASEAMAIIEQDEPDCIVCDLDLGSAFSGIDLLARLRSQRPWIGLIALTAHRDPALVGAGSLPEGVPYLVKSDVDDLDQLAGIVAGTIGPREAAGAVPGQPQAGVARVSGAQAAVLGLVAQGLSNEAIANQRGVSVRAVEYMLRRIYASLGLEPDDGRNARVDAIRIWRQGRVRVK